MGEIPNIKTAIKYSLSAWCLLALINLLKIRPCFGYLVLTVIGNNISNSVFWTFVPVYFDNIRWYIINLIFKCNFTCWTPF